VDTLKAMAIEVGIPVPKPEADIQETLASNDMSLEESTDNSPKIRTECLSDEKTLEVYMTECYSPDCFYLALVENMEKLDKLENEIRERISKEDPTCYMNAQVNDFVVFHDAEDGNFKRGQVKEVLRSFVEQGNELVIETNFRIFHLDSGITSKVVAFNIYKCWPEFLVSLPFQAVKCKLNYVAPLADEWEELAGDRLFDMSRNAEDNALMLQCNVVNRSCDGVYQVQLRVGLTSLDQDLIDAGLAKVDNSSSIESLTNPSEDKSTSESAFDISETGDFNVIDYEKLKGITAKGLESYVDEFLEPVVNKQTATRCEDTKETFVEERRVEKQVIDAPDISLPSDAVVQLKLPNISWSQKDGDVSIKIRISSLKDVSPSQVHVKVEQRVFSLEVLEVLVDAESAYEFILHRTPTMELNDEVLPRLTELSFKGSSINVKLIKKSPNAWGKLCTEKYSFVRIDPDVPLLEVDEEPCDESPEMEKVDIAYRREVQDIKFEFDQDESLSSDSTDSEEFDDNDAEDEKDLML